MLKYEKFVAEGTPESDQREVLVVLGGIEGKREFIPGYSAYSELVGLLIEKRQDTAAKRAVDAGIHLLRLVGDPGSIFHTHKMRGGRQDLTSNLISGLSYASKHLDHQTNVDLVRELISASESIAGDATYPYSTLTEDPYTPAAKRKSEHTSHRSIGVSIFRAVTTITAEYSIELGRQGVDADFFDSFGAKHGFWPSTEAEYLGVIKAAERMIERGVEKDQGNDVFMLCIKAKSQRDGTLDEMRELFRQADLMSVRAVRLAFADIDHPGE